ncbi:MAG: hypothetical protein JNM34_04830 [Chthonomonadaceae bacterium]|nr:hypothetical protein [Chthonomonadaceae bacterium]
MSFKRFSCLFAYVIVQSVVVSNVAEGQTLQVPWFYKYFGQGEYLDRFNNGQLENTIDRYPYFLVPILAKGDQRVSKFAPLVPFLTGVATFNDPGHPNCDPIVLSGAYNCADVSGLKIDSSEPSASTNLETNFLVPDNYYRQMEWYVSFRSTVGNPGLEYRPLTLDYAPDTGEMTGTSLSASSERWGANIDFSAPVGTIAGTMFAQLGWSTRNGGRINGFRHVGSLYEDTLIDVQAQGNWDSIVQLGSNGFAGAARWRTIGPGVAAFSVGAAADFVRFSVGDSSAQGSLSVNTPANSNRGALVVSGLSASLPTVVGRAAPGQTSPVLRLTDSSNTDPGSSQGEVYSIDASGRSHVKVQSSIASPGQGLSVLSAPFTQVLGAGASKGVTLPAAEKGLSIQGYNDSQNDLNLWPGLGGSINGLPTNASLTVPAHHPFSAVAYDGTHWSVFVGS